MLITPENYFSPEVKAAYFSSSEVKQAKTCEASWNAQRTGRYALDENKPAFVEGHLFETLVAGTEDEIALFQSRHPELFSTRGATKGELKSNFQNVAAAADAVKRQPFLMDFVTRSKKQQIYTGKIDGLPFRVMADLIFEDGSIYDLKAMKDFKPVWNDAEQVKQAWFDAWNYPMQLWIYREIARQNGLTVPHVGLIAASKSNADVQAVEFSQDTMDAAGADAHYTIARMKQILGGSEPLRCEACDYCIVSKTIYRFEEA